MTSPLTEFQPLTALRGSPHWVTASFAPLDDARNDTVFSAVMFPITFPNVYGLGDFPATSIVASRAWSALTARFS